MKNIAVIFAGGVGSRMENTTKPKQFLELYNKPIIIHTIEKFEHCNMIDAIAIACKEEYIEALCKLLNQYKLKKTRWLVKGGATGQLSIFNALKAVSEDESTGEDTVVLIHDGVRPSIDEQLILENIVTARSRGNAISVARANETIFMSKDGIIIDELRDRNEVYYAKAPQSFFLNDIFKLHLLEMEAGNINNIDSCSMAHRHGFELHFVHCKSSNIKITTYEDYYICKAIYELYKEQKRRKILS